MEEISLKAVVISLISVITYLLAAAGVLFWIFIILASIDFLTGIGKAYVKGELNSSTGRTGILRKVGTISILVIAVLLDLILKEHGIKTNGMVFHVVCSWYILMEILSVLENVHDMGVKIPLRLYHIVKVMSPGTPESPKLKGRNKAD